MPIKPDRPSGWTGLELPNSPTIWKKMKVGALCSCSKHGQKELSLTSKGNCCFSQSTAFMLMDLEGFAFKVVYVLWPLILGFFYCLWREGTVRGTLNLMVMLFLHLEQPSPIGSTQITSCSTASVLLQQFLWGTLGILLIWQILVTQWMYL